MGKVINIAFSRYEASRFNEFNVERLLLIGKRNIFVWLCLQTYGQIQLDLLQSTVHGYCTWHGQVVFDVGICFAILRLRPQINLI